MSFLKISTKVLRINIERISTIVLEILSTKVLIIISTIVLKINIIKISTIVLIFIISTNIDNNKFFSSKSFIYRKFYYIKTFSKNRSF